MLRIALLEPPCTDQNGGARLAGLMPGWCRYELGSQLTALDGGRHA